MCTTCGCGSDEGVVTDPDHRHDHNHDHHHHHDDRSARTIVLEQAVLSKNDALAQANRSWFAEQRILAVNLMSSPGAGKTTLLERTITDLSVALPMAAG